MALTERLALLLTIGGTNDVVRGLDQVAGGGRRIAETEPRMARLGSTMTRTVTPAALGLATASGLMFNEFDQGADALRAAGATGDEFTDSMKRVAGNVPASIGQVGQVMGELFQRTKLTGPALEELTQQVLELGELGQSVSVEQITASLAKAGVEAEDMAASLDSMFRVAQTTGTSVAKLSELLETNGSVLDALKLPFEDQLLLMGQLEAQGINTGSVMSGLGRAYRTLAQETEDPTGALMDLIQRMADADTQAEATAIASDLFGRSATEMGAAAQTGALDIDAMREALSGNTDSIHDAAEGTRDWQERLAMAHNRVVGVLGPLGQMGMAVGGLAAGLGPLATGLSKVGNVTNQAGRASLFLHDHWQSLAVAGTAAIAVIGLYAQKMAEAEAEQQRFRAAVDDFAGAMRETGDPVDALNQRVSETIEQSSQIANALAEMGASGEDMSAAIAAGGDEWDRFADRLAAAMGGGEFMRMTIEGLRDQYVAATEAAGNMNEALEEQETATAKVKDTSDDAATSQGRFATEISSVTKAAQDEIATLEELLDIINGSIDAGFQYQESIFASEDAIQRLIDAQNDGESTAGDLERAELDAAQALVDQSRAAADAAEQQATLAGQHLTASEKAAIQRGELERLAEKYPALADEIRGFIDQLRAVPAVTKAKVELDVSQALEAIGLVRATMAGIMDSVGVLFGANPGSRTPTPTNPTGNPRSTAILMDGEKVGVITERHNRRRTLGRHGR